MVELLGGEKMPDKVRAKVFLDCLKNKFQSFGRDSGGPSATIKEGPIMTFGWGMPVGAIDQLIDFDQLIAADIWGLGLAVAASLYWHQLRYYCSHDKDFVREVYGKEDASGSSFISMRESSASYVRITEPSRTQVREMESAGVGDDILAYHGMFYMYSLAFLFKQVEKFSKEVGTLQQITRPNFSKIKDGMGWNAIQSDQKKTIMLAQGLRLMNEALSTFDTHSGTGGLNELIWVYFRCFKLLMEHAKGDKKLRKIASYAVSTLREYLSIAIKDLSVFNERIQEITSLLSQIKGNLPDKDRIRVNQVVSYLKDVLS